MLVFQGPTGLYFYAKVLQSHSMNKLFCLRKAKERLYFLLKQSQSLLCQSALPRLGS
jgi:hypothetical protein